jgi:hypothetical protein
MSTAADSTADYAYNIQETPCGTHPAVLPMTLSLTGGLATVL